MKRIWGIMIIMTAVLLTGCTVKKDNPVGYNPVGEPQYIEIGTENISNVYSFEDSVNNYVNSSVLTIGNREQYDTMLLLHVGDLPDTLAEITDNEIKLSLVISKQTNSETNTYEYGRINQLWDEDEITYKTCTDTSDWVDPFTEEYGVYEFSGEYSAYDTLDILLPMELFYTLNEDVYEVDSLASNYGLYFKRQNPDTERRDFIEYFSKTSDSNIQPRLRFSYKLAIEDSEYVDWESITINDATLYSQLDDNTALEYYEVNEDELMLRNISPVKMYMEISLDSSDFADTLSNTIIDSYQYNNMTINKAYLVLHAKEDYFGSNSYIYTQPALLISEVPAVDNEIPMYKDDYNLISGVVTTQDSLDTIGEDKIFKIDVTSEIQAITTDHDDNEGIGLVIRSLRENRDFSYVKFYSSAEDVSKGPYLEIYFSLPLEP
ncbi:MAG: hypothetical protein RAO94_02840 [Candidatus Stygibacter australis]|nr:hypothetical protein [Candidatus Stygibacter australis]MDP8321270.1 hypothetical protein [Candidatus Stygibacter australis]